MTPTIVAPANVERANPHGAPSRRTTETHPSLNEAVRQAEDHLGLVFEITSCIADLSDPQVIRDTLLRRHGELLQAHAVLLDHERTCVRLTRGSAAAPFEPSLVRATLGEQIEAVRTTRQAVVVRVNEPAVDALHEASVLLSTLGAAGAEQAVVIVIRHRCTAPFSDADLLASESVLALGRQILCRALTIQDMQRTALQTVRALVNAIDAKDNYTSDHSERVGALAVRIGERLGLEAPRIQALEWAGLLHDVGKIGVPEHILRKPGPLSAEEMEQMKQHPRAGYDMLQPVTHIGHVLDSVLYHHENHDGSGYPEGLAGDAIPVDAQIIHVVDIYDALTTNRPYRQAYSPEHALQIVADGSGTITSPELTRIFIEIMRDDRALDDPGLTPEPVAGTVTGSRFVPLPTL